MISSQIIIPSVLILSFILVSNASGIAVYGQQFNQTNQTDVSQANQTELTNQTAPPPAPFADEQLQRAENQVQLAEQIVDGESNQTNLGQQEQTQMQQGEMTNQTNSGQQGQPEMNERLLNFTNNAIIALENDDEDMLEQSLLQIQGTLLNATDKQIIVIPASAAPSSVE